MGWTSFMGKPKNKLVNLNLHLHLFSFHLKGKIKLPQKTEALSQLNSLHLKRKERKTMRSQEPAGIISSSSSLISAGLSSPVIQHPTITPHFSSFNSGFYLPLFSDILTQQKSEERTHRLASNEWREGTKNREDGTARETNKGNISYLSLCVCSKRRGENSSLRFGLFTRKYD